MQSRVSGTIATKLELRFAFEIKLSHRRKTNIHRVPEYLLCIKVKFLLETKIVKCLN